MTPPSLMESAGAALFGLAILHTFSTSYFSRLAQIHPRHASLWHVLGDVEWVFGLWAVVLLLFMAGALGPQQAMGYLRSLHFTEPLFVLTIMVIAATRPVLQLAEWLVRGVARALPLPSGLGLYWVVLTLVPLLGSLITEPAAMTLAALILRDTVLARTPSLRLKYATLGVLFVNISIGGTLTPFAAPPVLMVAAAWQWDLGFMMTVFGAKAALVVGLNAAAITWLFRHPLTALAAPAVGPVNPVPWSWMLLHLTVLVLVVVWVREPLAFMALGLGFVGLVRCFPRHQDPLLLRQALGVAGFLAGLVVLGGWQRWWLEPLLTHLDADGVFYGALALTAITDNAALTYLGTLVPGLSLAFKTALVSGAVLGGGLTLIANAPNPAAAAILKDCFPGRAIQPLYLLLAALPPTALGVLVFRWG